MTKLSAALPDPEFNGLSVIAHRLVNHPDEEHLVVARIRTRKITTDIETGGTEATVRVIAIETVLDGDTGHGQRLMNRATEQRTGQKVLPFENEIELRSVDPETGEIS